MTYAYDFAGRRIRKTAGTTTNRYCYDGDQIIADYNDSGVLQRRYVYGPGIDEPLYMVTVLYTYYYYFDGLGSVVALARGDQPAEETYSYDVFGKPTIRNAQGGILTTSAFGNRYMFTGREWEPETGLYYYRARYYKPSIGRFLQPDPISIYLIPLCVASPQGGAPSKLYVSNQALTKFLKDDPIGQFLNKDPKSRLSQIALMGQPDGGFYIDLNPYNYAGNNPIVFVDPSGQLLWKGGIGVIGIIIGVGIGGTGGIVIGVIGGGLIIWEGWDIWDYFHHPPGEDAFRQHADDINRACDDQ